ncbi:MAG: phosphoadenylyl-sulfate reductase [Saprospiraceae bacterium]|jgi:phosphoadenosine phosphosulfate reductase|nr:phosphoadenylyl-sulfate reductase [Saprospiraceae bacterium]
MNRINSFSSIAEISNPLEILKSIAQMKGEKIVFSTSLSAEDQVITHMIFSLNLDIEIFTLDTGRMFPETYQTLQKTLEKYQKEIKVYFPAAEEVEELMTEKGAYSFYDSVENRKQCCEIRKVKPLKRSLKGKTIWITGIRSEHSQNRTEMQKIEWDAANNITKIHPLLHWSNDEVWTYIKANNVPYNSLHDKGFISIGCQPCTRAVKEGEDFRAGRWWWEDTSKKECGLHSIKQ